MRRIFFLLLLLVFIFCVSPYGKVDPVSSPPPSEQENITEAVIPTEEPLTEEPLVVLDYAEIILNSDFYSGKEVVVAGRIADFSPSPWGNKFVFRDRLGYKQFANEFIVSLAQTNSHEESACDLYGIGDYILVKGIWGNVSGNRLSDAVVLSTGDEAKAYSDIFMEQWEAKGKNYAATLPITEYMDIVNNPEAFEGQRIRTVGQIRSTDTDSFKHHIDFSLYNRETNKDCISFSLHGCPQEMQDLCIENQYVVISGVVKDGVLAPYVYDCFVECVGEPAEVLAKQSEAAWLQKYQEQRIDYISTCADYSYEELARFPQNYTGNHIKISGRVLKTATNWGNNIILLDIGGGNCVYIDYTGKQYRDPEILPGDEIVFYGKCSGKTTYSTILDDSSPLPLITALYSSFNLQ